MASRTKGFVSSIGSDSGRSRRHTNLLNDDVTDARRNRPRLANTSIVSGMPGCTVQKAAFISILLTNQRIQQVEHFATSRANIGRAETDGRIHRERKRHRLAVSPPRVVLGLWRSANGCIG
ncbi:unnamed protein product [Sphagnum balticum]